MSETARHFSRIAATLFLAFALIFVARAPIQHQVAEASELTSMQASMPCENMVKHATVDMPSGAQDHGSADKDRCCGGALCAGYTLDGVDGDLTPSLPALSFAQSPPDVLHVAEIALPKRPPRFL
jgi:hypothetical protein